MLGIGVSLRYLRGSAAPFSPKRLFANNEPGVWYDPSDLTTLFQDTAGTTPVTAPGQTVGLMLDKSKGLTLGPELVTNGTFDTNISGWSDFNATSAWASGAISVSHGATASGAYQAFTTVPGKTYRASVDVVSSTSFSVNTRVRCGDGATPNAGLADSAAITAPGTVGVVFVAASTTSYVYLRNDLSATTIWDNVSVREIPGFHARQATAAARPVYQVDAGGRGYLAFDGVDDFMVTPTITPGTDKVQVFAGVRKLSDASGAALLELSVDAGTNNGTLALFAPIGSGTPGFWFRSRGTLAADVSVASPTAPVSAVVSGLGDISGDTAKLRVNGTQVAQSTADQGAGNYLSYPLYIGRRGGTTVPFNGHIYSLITRFGPNLDTTVIESTEGYVAGKTGVTL